MMVSALLDGLRRELTFLRGSFWDLSLITWIPLVLLGTVAIQMSAGVMRDLPIIVIDRDGGIIARELTRRLDAAPGLSVAEEAPSMTIAEDGVRSRKAFAIVLIDRDTTKTVLQGGTAQVVALYNASYSTPAGSVLRDVGSVVQSYGAVLGLEESAAILGPARVRRPPLSIRSTILFNPQGSYELQLVALIQPAVLHLIFMNAITGALGRELRDGSIGSWIGERPAGFAAWAVFGKLLPYFCVFMAWGVAATAYIAGLRGWPIAGSPLLIFVGYAAMYLAYIGVAVLFVGLTLTMGTALSAAGLYAGASFAFAGAVFPVESASAFARVWSALLPYTSFAKLLSEQWVMGSAAGQSMRQVLIMLIFLVVGIAVGLPRYVAAAKRPATWGRR
ncbi:ABC transporter permease [Roseomonas aeriglobus]|nr:ABC transporter permease [Roseomonas aeriglobus]